MNGIISYFNTDLLHAMEIYKAISEFSSPNVDGSNNILSFDKGDRFEVFDCHKSDNEWWGARALKNSGLGYVPSRYMQYEERKIGKLGEETDNPSEKDAPPQKSPTEMDSNIDNLKDLKDAAQIMPESPVPDYGEGDSPTPDSSFVFARKFKSVLTSIKQIDDYDEPAPDYLDEDDGSAIRNNLIMLKADDLNQKLQEGDGELIPPKKLVNPCLESKTRVALHKELKYQYKMGFNVLEKPELTRVLTKRKEQQRIQEWDDQKKASMKRSSLEMKLEQRANKLKEEEDKVMQPIKEDKEEMKPEMLKVHAKITQKSESNGIK